MAETVDGEDTGSPIGSVLDAIASGSWKSALFTTFTLSLTYLESHVIPALRRGGCESLSIMVDVAGYRDSLVELKSRSVGRDYAVVPIRVKGGIFHPKLVHLEAREGEDLLLVGSGNLTFPGHGGNVEVLEVLRPSRHASAFRQAADYFDELANTRRVHLPDQPLASKAAERLRTVAAMGRDEESVRFIHSLNTSGFAQFAQAATDLGPGWQQLLVLSPYHHPLAGPIVDLADALRIDDLLVGVPATAGATTAFPFNDVRWRFPKLEAVAPAPEKRPERGVHAKWFELRGRAGALMLTGSFNATEASFGSTDNVECGVLRHEPQASSNWTPVAVPPYMRMEFPQCGQASTGCIYARVSSGNRLEGVVLAADLPPGQWHAVLESSEALIGEDDVDVAADGAFTWMLPERFSLADVGALQISLTRGERRARGWLQASQVLGLDARQRKLLDAATRLARRAESADDVASILEFLAEESASLLLQASPQPISNQSAGEVQNRGDEGVLDAAQFAAIPVAAEQLSTYEGSSFLEALSTGARGWDLLEHIVAALIPRERPAHPGAPSHYDPSTGNPFDHAPNRAPAADGEDQEALKVAQKQAEKVDKVLQIFERRHDDAKTRLARTLESSQRERLEMGRMRLLVLWSATVLRFKVIEEGDADGAMPFYWRWFKEVCALRLPMADKARLGEQICGVAAALASWLSGFPPTIARAPLDVHRQLEWFFGLELVAEQAIDSAGRWLREAGKDLVAQDIEGALTALARVLAKPTERQVLRRLVEEGLVGNERLLDELEEPAIGGPSLRALFAEAGRAAAEDAQRLSRVRLQELTRCPNQRCPTNFLTFRGAGGVRQLDSEINWRLKKYGIWKCQCRQLLLALETGL